MLPAGTPADYRVVAIFLAVGVLFIVLTLMASWAVRRRGRMGSPAKYTTYECGEAPVGEAWGQFHIGYYVFALMFVVFDVEVMVMAPWAVGYLHMDDGLKPMAFIAMLVFVLPILIGLLYEWKRGVLKWI
jgi:NADH-quinone oxidoreductase subunit A